MTWRNVLLRAYPRSWRVEYGEELAGILAQRRLTLAVLADVLGNGVRQHLHRDEPWKICGAGLALWIMMTRPVAVFFPNPYTYRFWWASGSLIVLAAGAWTVERSKAGLLPATVASAKAALAGQAGAVVLMLLALPREYAYSYLGHSIYYWFLKTLALSLALSVSFGFVGALLARGISRLRSPAPQSR